MKFSVLLPTRDRLELLRKAVETVRMQDYTDWEIVVADNASRDDVATYVRGLDDARVKFTRSEAPLQVTENWNRALELAQGDYVVMLGDDDGLLPGYFRENAGAIERFGWPELVYVQGVQFAYAGVIPGKPRSFVQVPNCEFIRGETEPFALAHDRAVRLVADSARFRVAFAYNMQHALVSRALVERMRRACGPFFQSPYPDYYATNAALLAAGSILVQPLPLVVVGISPKSFGFYYFNDREEQGVEFLGNRTERASDASLQGTILPGSDMNTSWLLAMDALQRNWGGALGIEVVRWRYRFLQFRHAYLRLRLGPFLEFVRTHGKRWEAALWSILAVALRLLPAGRGALLDAIHCAYPRARIFRRDVQAEDIVAFARQFDARAFHVEYLRAQGRA